MRCPNCGGDRLALIAAPGDRPDRTVVCLACAAVWLRDAPAESTARGALRDGGGAAGRA